MQLVSPFLLPFQLFFVLSIRIHVPYGLWHEKLGPVSSLIVQWETVPYLLQLVFLELLYCDHTFDNIGGYLDRPIELRILVVDISNSLFELACYLSFLRFLSILLALHLIKLLAAQAAPQQLRLLLVA